MLKAIFAVFVGLVLTSHVRAQVPVIYAQSGDITLQVGQTASLAVNVTSNLPVTFEWFANSQLIPAATAQAYTTQPVTLSTTAPSTFVLSSIPMEPSIASRWS